MIELESRLVADGFIFPEGLKWHDGKLWLSDVFGHRVYWVTPDGGRQAVVGVPTRPSGLGFLADGTLVIASATDKRLIRLDGDKTSTYADLSAHATGFVNDFAVDAAGRIYVGNFGYDIDGGAPAKPTSLHRVDPDGTIATVATGVEFPNGSAVIDGGRTLVVAETWVGRISAFDLDASGNLSNQRLFADLEDREPDGLCADTEGALWVGCFNTGEFIRVLDGGEITHRVAFDGRAVTCALGGEGSQQLFMSAYLGPVSDIGAGKAKGAIFVAPAPFPAIGI